jgi:hypothetical protein
VSETPVEALFAIDAESPEDVFRGVHFPDHRWNGWAMPSFPREQVERIIARFGQPGQTTFTWDGDVLLVHEADYAEEPGYTPERVTPDAAGNYPLGAGSWTWSEVEIPEGVDMGAFLAWSMSATRAYVSANNEALTASHLLDGDQPGVNHGQRARTAADAALATWQAEHPAPTAQTHPAR